MTCTKKHPAFEGAARTLLCLLVFETLPVATAQNAPVAQAAQPLTSGLNLIIVEGDGALNNLRARTAREAIVQVEDSNHKPIAGAMVTFTTPGAGPTGLFSNGSRVLTVVTNSKGQAIMSGLKTNQVAGALKINVTASFQGQTTTAAITQTNAAAAAGTSTAGGLLSVKAIAIIAGIGAAAVAGTVIGLTRGGGNTNPATTSTTISAGTVTLGPPH